MVTCSTPVPPTPPITLRKAADGTLVYLVEIPPEAMPSVRVRDLAQAWDQARDAARARAWGAPRSLRFQREDGTYTHLALADRDAICWAGAVDRSVGLTNSYGLSLCLRFLALVNLLARAPWAAPLLALQPGGARLHPGLLRLAATVTLTSEALFDERRFHAELGHLTTVCTQLRSGGPVGWPPE
jgi:hypothetical protein